MPGSTAGILVSAGFLVVWLLLGVRGFRSVLARGWHDQLGSVQFPYTIMPTDVAVGFYVTIELMSDSPYHRHGQYDQRVEFSYDVEPPH